MGNTYLSQGNELRRSHEMKVLTLISKSILSVEYRLFMFKQSQDETNVY